MSNCNKKDKLHHVALLSKPENMRRVREDGNHLFKSLLKKINKSK